MSIIQSYDPCAGAVLNPSEVYQPRPTVLDACILNFSYKIMDALLQEDLLELIDANAICSTSFRRNMYVFRGTNIGVIQISVGSAIASVILEEVAHIYSCKKFILFGSCGGLDRALTAGKRIIPTHAYRDEGVSYHYLPAEDYIPIPNHPAVAAVLDTLEVPYVLGRTWTTDAPYRETRRNVEARRAEGCICVEMEVAACQAVAAFRGLEFYNFLYAADNLDAPKWEARILGNMPIDRRLSNFYIALEIAKAVV